ncbi:hypothetical protein BKK79_37025 (plasmid) [Cupriavidus sp. USMAA2-4]|uniref:type II secretion system protein GspM n=1 Tax=Cupriavidus sp. USMAA2-4 TaxID=876364 RepID=UPI0008A699BB|nr:type II secretion system protein GspM [Cupriavidus sp. USMAA2-4]AOY97545.1 hypothetical protein BKK79_37025 [Cupriavidus sp. USMAA2-4]
MNAPAEKPWRDTDPDALPGSGPGHDESGNGAGTPGDTRRSRSTHGTAIRARLRAALDPWRQQWAQKWAQKWAPKWAQDWQPRWQSKWQQLPPRDRRAVLACAAVLGTGALWQFGWESAAGSVPRLQHELPETQAQAQQVHRLAHEAARLRALPALPERTPEALREGLRQSLQAAGLKGATVEGGAPLLRVRAGPVSFHAWMQWLARARAEYGVAVVAMEARASGGERGEVAVQAELALPGR